MKILVLNAGSSTQKSCLYDFSQQDFPQSSLPENPLKPLWEASIDGQQLKVTTLGGNLEKQLEHSLDGGLAQMLETLWEGDSAVIQHPGEIEVVGHRVVHGGREYHEPTRITEAVKKAIADLSVLAPTHNPAALAGIEAIEGLMGDVPQIAVFDTAFHATLPDEAAIYPGPYAWVEQGIRRYGFHGINHQYCARRAAQLLNRELESLRLISCHLGNGCSLAAIQGGRSLDTTMGFTPLDGLMMGTRSGSVDPGILLYLLKQQGVEAKQLDVLLNKESGLKGISGLSGDMREIAVARANGHAQAQLAFDIYVHRLRSSIGAMLGTLGGLDALIFTAGVGEHSAEVRAAACENFAFVGLELSAERNASQPVDEDIATLASKVRVLVIQAQEDWAIACECRNLMLNAN